MNYEALTPVAMLCPNCGNKCIGYRIRDGTARFDCERCGLLIASKKKSERVADLRLTAPLGQTLF